MDIENLIQISIIEINSKSIKFTKKTKLWCRLPYPNHPKGCPNYNKNPLCPPVAKYMENIVKNYFHFFLIYAEFDLKSQRDRMLSKHPNWSIKQANCLLYWQNSVKKKLKESIKTIYLENKERKLFLFSCGSGFDLNYLSQKEIYSMEAAGIDVYNTLRNNHIDFEIKPENKVILTTLLCSKESLSIEL